MSYSSEDLEVARLESVVGEADDSVRSLDGPDAPIFAALGRVVDATATAFAALHCVRGCSFVEQLSTSGFTPGARVALAGSLHGQPAVDWVPFDSSVAAERSAPRTYRASRRHAVGVEQLLDNLGLRGGDVLRILIRDEGVPVGWLAFFREAPFAVHEEERLSPLLPSVVTRVLSQRQGRAVRSLESTCSGLLHRIEGGLRIERDGPFGPIVLAMGLVNGTGPEVRTPVGPGLWLVRRVSAEPIEDSFEERVVRFSSGHGLTARQAHVLEIMLRGYSNNEIGRVLGIAHGTVEVHVSEILRRCRVDSRTRLCARFWGVG